jgi:hypothetical protein
MLAWMRVLLLLALVGCTTKLGDDVVTEDGACTALEGRQFTSLHQLECGLGPSGVEYCNWQLAFHPLTTSSSQFQWSHSDVGETGTTECHGSTVVGHPGPGRDYAGTIDLDTGVLTWDGESYAP